MKSFSKGLLFGVVIGGISGWQFLTKTKKTTPTAIEIDLAELNDLTKRMAQQKERLKQATETVQQSTELLLTPFIQGVQQDVKKYKFQTEPRINQLKEQAEKIVSEISTKK